MVKVSPGIVPRPFPAMSDEERLYLTLTRLLRRLPVRTVSRLGAILGPRLGRRAHPAAAGRTRLALTRFEPGCASNPALLETMQRRLWANIGRVYAEFCSLDRIVLEGRVSGSDNPLLARVLSDGRPVIIAYPHLGNWEATLMELARLAPQRVCALADPLPANRVRAEVASRQRAQWPLTFVHADPLAWRRLLAHLRRPDGILYIAIDEHAGAGVKTPAFGRPLEEHSNFGKIVRLAARTGAIILPAYTERLPGARFHAHFLEPLYPDDCLEPDPEQLTRRMQRLNALFEPVVQRHLDQWFGLLEYRP